MSSNAAEAIKDLIVVLTGMTLIQAQNTGDKENTTTIPIKIPTLVANHLEERLSVMNFPSFEGMETFLEDACQRGIISWMKEVIQKNVDEGILSENATFEEVLSELRKRVAKAAIEQALGRR